MCVGEGFTVLGGVSWTRNDLRQRHDNSTCIALFPPPLPSPVKFIHSFLRHEYRKVEICRKIFSYLQKKKKKLSLLELHFMYEIGNKVGYRRSKRL